MMKIGITTFITDTTMQPDKLGRAVEERGFESFFLPEHSHVPVSRETPYPFGDTLPDPYYRTWDPFVALAAVAVATSTLRLGTGVTLLTQRDVIQTAKEVASLDLLSNGRFMFGVGAGWNREEMRNHGTDPASRGALFDEQIAALKTIWSMEQSEFHGDYVSFNPIFQWPKPMQRPHPTIYVGGNSEAAITRALRIGDGWIPIAVNEAESLRRLDKLAAVADKCGLLRQ